MHLLQIASAKGDDKWEDMLHKYYTYSYEKYLIIDFTEFWDQDTPLRLLWQYGLWNFQTGGTKLEIFFA